MPAIQLKNLSTPELVEWALKLEKDTTLSDRGALSVRSYLKTGRSPSDKRIADTDCVRDTVNWGKVNIKLSEKSFASCKKRAVDFLNSRERVFIVDCFAGHDPKYQIKVRVITTRPYHALFMRNMLIVPTPEQLANFGNPDYIIYNAGECDADTSVEGVTSKTSVSINFKTREQVILGTQYAGEMKKGVLTVMFYIMPKAGHLCMHASANEGKGGDVSVFFGLSGTGKTTLSADPHRVLVGDDEHVWTDTGVFNIEGGCYAKAIGLNPKTEFEIWNAVRFGSVAENCHLDPKTKEIDFNDERICKNTRVAYPLNYIDNSKTVAVTGHPNNIIFLTNDAFGVLPPVSKLSRGAAMFWFVTGYTANVAGVVAGASDEPSPVFSPCFGAPFLVLHPTHYGKQLAEKLEKHDANCWMVNTGYSGGSFGKGGKRMPLKVTRALLDLIHEGKLINSKWVEYEGWGIHIPVAVDHSSVPDEILNPAKVWRDKKEYYITLNKLAKMFQDNFRVNFEEKADMAMKAAVPREVVPAKL
eukprot:Tbor_TRINITY_DN5654_c2_g5::TRINITY_DN5654_c2_g5_i1::g.9349::m.9349/K01610/E4.1.1.49, pckA; phosphoenolpyruvate carboxykinase (ATP)